MLITPERLLKRVGQKSPKALAVLIHKKLQIELDPLSETHANYLAHPPNVFNLSFYQTEDAVKIMTDVQKRIDAVSEEFNMKEKEPEYRILPPLFLLSNEKFVILFDDIMLFAYASGPIVPVVQLQKVRENSILNSLILLYSKSCPDFVNIDSARDILQPSK